MDWATRSTETMVFIMDSKVNGSDNVLHIFHYKASRLAPLAEIPNAAYRASPAKWAGSFVFFSCN